VQIASPEIDEEGVAGLLAGAEGVTHARAIDHVNHVIEIVRVREVAVIGNLDVRVKDVVFELKGRKVVRALQNSRAVLPSRDECIVLELEVRDVDHEGTVVMEAYTPVCAVVYDIIGDLDILGRATAAAGAELEESFSVLGPVVMDVRVVTLVEDLDEAAIRAVVIARCYAVDATVVGNFIVARVEPEADRTVVIVPSGSVDDHREIMHIVFRD
jgi:hypothetical protein